MLLVGFTAVNAGRVTARRIGEHGRGEVELELWCDTDFGLRTNTGSAVVELPSRGGRGAAAR